jgi:aryl-alcohol dehydrogenase-like predicted oxidoreductase
VDALERLVDKGYTTLDFADHYGDAELFYGQLMARLGKRGPETAPSVSGFTKWVPSASAMTRPVVEAAVRRSLKRMKVSRLDLMQFHWWDYSDKRYLDALRQLSALRDEGLIREIGLTNFDTETTRAILEAGIPIVSSQTQFSVIDSRPIDGGLAALCEERDVKILAYGVLAGGLLSDKWLGAAEPKYKSDLPYTSHRKYFMGTVRPWGDWSLFQELLRTLKAVGEKHGDASISVVSMAWVLRQPAVGGVIVGLRAGLSDHADENARAVALATELTEADLAAIAAVQAKGTSLLKTVGDCGDEYRS